MCGMKFNSIATSEFRVINMFIFFLLENKYGKLEKKYIKIKNEMNPRYKIKKCIKGMGKIIVIWMGKFC